MAALSSVPAIDLGARVIREVLDRTGTDGADVDQLIMGNVLGAGQGQVPSRQAGLRAGLPADGLVVHRQQGLRQRAQGGEPRGAADRSR